MSILYDFETGACYQSNEENLEKATEELWEQLYEEHKVTLGDVYEELGLDAKLADDELLEGWGWTKKNPTFHKLTLQERYDVCPCCGRPWNEGSE